MQISNMGLLKDSEHEGDANTMSREDQLHRGLGEESTHTRGHTNHINHHLLCIKTLKGMLSREKDEFKRRYFTIFGPNFD